MEKSKKKEREIIRINRQLAYQNTIIINLLKEHNPTTTWISKKKAADIYGVSLKTIYNWDKSGQLNSKIINGKKYYDISILM